MESKWHTGHSNDELASELIRRFGWAEMAGRAFRLLLRDMPRHMADILGEMDRLRSLLRNCQTPDGRSCAVCGDNGHQAAECHHIDQVDPDAGGGAVGLERNFPIGIRRALEELEVGICERLATKGRGQFATMLDDMADIISSDEVSILRQVIAEKEWEILADRFRYMAVSAVLMLVCIGEIDIRLAMGAQDEG